MRNIKRGIKQIVVDNRPQFKKHNKAIKRQAKIVQLATIATSDKNMSVRCEARREHKQMFTFRIGRTKINTTGFYEKSGRHPLRCKAKAK